MHTGRGRVGEGSVLHSRHPSELPGISESRHFGVDSITATCRRVQHFIEAHGFPAIPRSVVVMVQILVDSKIMSGLIRMKDAEKERDTYPPPLSIYSAPGGLRQDPGRAVESPAGARIRGNGSREMRVLSSAFGSRGDLPCPIVASDSDRS